MPNIYIVMKKKKIYNSDIVNLLCFNRYFPYDINICLKESIIDNQGRRKLKNSKIKILFIHRLGSRPW